MPKKYEHLFFDLDRTLYDFENNNRQTLSDLFCNHRLESLGVDCFDSFYQTYKTINYGLWQRYKNQEITKEYLNQTRFEQTLGAFQISNGLAAVFASEYITNSPLQTKVLPGTFEILDYLSGKYVLHIITNGFEEIQYQKLSSCGITGYFKEIITSEAAGAQKPNQAIFRHAMEVTGATPALSLIIGDDPESDILGGQQFNIDQVWLKQPGEASDIVPTYCIGSLMELKEIL